MAVRDGSDLCLGCGICCTGIFFLKVAVTPEEAQRIEPVGVLTHREEEKNVFPLPCSAHHDKRCTIYAQRPGICQAYTCKLLDRYLAGEVSLAEAEGHTAELARLYRQALSMVTGGDRRFVWKLIHTKLGDADIRELLGVPEELGAVVDALRRLIQEEFKRMGAVDP